MDYSAFMTSLLDLVFFPFDKVDSPLVLVPATVMLFCLSFGIIRRLIRLF